jgi:DNA replication and repair protein RecF
LVGSLQESTEKDLAIGHTTQGPHRMDCLYCFKGKKASSVLSRGQLKVLILLIFLINQKLINSFVESEIILLIDDLGSELDLENLDAVLSEISKASNQVILTGVQGESLEKIVSKFSNFKRINL